VPDPIVTTSLAADWGPIRLAASSRGLVAVEQLTSPEEFEARLTRRFGAAPVPLEDSRDLDLDLDDAAADEGADQPAHHAAADQPAHHAGAEHLREARAAFERFLGGDLAALDGLPVDIADRTSWDRDVMAAVRTIRAGSTASYGEVARMVGNPGAARAVGGAVGRNPLCLVVPCHRVIAGDGTIGGYGGGWWGGRQAGLELKRHLLAREGVHLSSPSTD
jgi:methylated-DNA-[protein]-cysteine S-methyltransferase